MENQENKLILVVEDDLGVQRVIQQVLNQCGYKTAVYSLGNEAIDWIKNQGGNPALITLDLKLKDISGQKFLSELVSYTLRSNPAFSSSVRRPPPVLVITGSGGLGLLPTLEKNLVCGVLYKPFTIQELKAAVQAYLG